MYTRYFHLKYLSKMAMRLTMETDAGGFVIVFVAVI